MSEYDEENAFGEPAGSGLPMEARRALITLQSSLFITRGDNRTTWDAVVAHEDDLRERLAESFMQLMVDHEMGVAFKIQDPDESAPRVLKRKRQLSRDASLLLIYLRKEYIYSDDEDGAVVVSKSQIEEFLRTYREEGDGDGAKFDRRVDAAIQALDDLNLLRADQDAGYLYVVSPAVVPLIGPDELLRFEAVFQHAAGSEEPS
ncbi:DUF4194 domain-containing protein [Kribbella sp. NPDC059898]|uniref:DUF4194 domain-containing protein n=1 Tax=Kribbella sp. NPDC059898 TaxID=3346995 RepID=UPI003663D6D1